MANVVTPENGNRGCEKNNRIRYFLNNIDIFFYTKIKSIKLPEYFIRFTQFN